METAIKLSPVDMDSRKKLTMKAGDTIRVYSKIQEKGKTRLQAFEGLVLSRKHGNELGATVTVRKISQGVGVERIFPLYSPLIDRIEIIKQAKVRRSKLYFLREKTAKEIRKKLKAFAFIAPEEEKITADMLEDDTEGTDEPSSTSDGTRKEEEVKESHDAEAMQDKEEAPAEETPEESKEEGNSSTSSEQETEEDKEA